MTGRSRAAILLGPALSAKASPGALEIGAIAPDSGMPTLEIPSEPRAGLLSLPTSR